MDGAYWRFWVSWKELPWRLCKMAEFGVIGRCLGEPSPVTDSSTPFFCTCSSSLVHWATYKGQAALNLKAFLKAKNMVLILVKIAGLLAKHRSPLQMHASCHATPACHIRFQDKRVSHLVWNNSGQKLFFAVFLIVFLFIAEHERTDKQQLMHGSIYRWRQIDRQDKQKESWHTVFSKHPLWPRCKEQINNGGTSKVSNGAWRQRADERHWS